MKTKILFLVLIGLIFVSCNKKSPDLILACGWDEVFMADISKEVPEKLWSWTAGESEGLPTFMRNKFQTTDDCKSYDDGKTILITSSGGGLALVEQKSGSTLFYASVPNAHSAELLPDNLLVAAASFSSEGNRLNLYNIDKSDDVIYSDSLYGAHGVQWDEKRDALWALGTKELRKYSLISDNEKHELKLDASFDLPDNDGHDLTFLEDKDALCLSTGLGVWYFDIKESSFSKHPELGDVAKIKSLSYSKLNNSTAYVKASDESWWAYYIRFAGSKKVVYLPGEKIYKVRWIYE